MNDNRTTAKQAALPANRRAHLCTAPGCGRLTLADRCDRHRTPPAPAGERVIAARARDESSRTLGETVKETPRDGH